MTEYGYPRLAPYNEFLPADTWTVKSNLYYTLLTPIGGHPNGIFSPASTPIDQWAVRRWMSDVDEKITLSGTFAKLDTRNGGDGVRGEILLDGIPIFSQFIANNDSEGINYSIDTLVKKGSIVDFVIDSNGGNEINDSTKFTATISKTNSIPEPGTAFALCVFGLILLFNKKPIF